MNKQIEELGKEIHSNCPCGLFEDEAESIAKFVIEEQGYRKQSDVAREIFEEIEKMVYSKCFSMRADRDVTGLIIDGELLAELKKKYGVTEE